jgi:hypothetical protein
MIVTTEAISKVPVCENACSRCNGVGKVWTIPYSTNHEAWQSECDSCFGEKVMTVELLERHSKGDDLRDLIRDKYKTLRELSLMFGGTLTEWSDAKRGKSSLAEILHKIEQVQTLPDFIRPEPKPYERPKLKTNFE